MYNSYEAACGATLSSKHARHEVESHGLAWSDFVCEVGAKETYTGQEVLDWLGY